MTVSASEGGPSSSNGSPGSASSNGAGQSGQSQQASQGSPQRTIGQMLGEIVWVMTQSPTHKHFSLSDLEWLVMPPLLLEQYRIFKDNDKPIAVALWAYLDDDAEQKLLAGRGRLMPQEWSAGAEVNPERGLVPGEGGTLWLVDLICPFANPENKLLDKCLADLMQSAFKGKQFKFHHTDPSTGERKVVELGG